MQTFTSFSFVYDILIFMLLFINVTVCFDPDYSADVLKNDELGSYPKNEKHEN